jgi:hypothetical protein
MILLLLACVEPPLPPEALFGDLDGDGVTSDEGDCNDDDPAIHPGAEETCDGVDQDCDGEIDEEATDGDRWYEDLDGDGYAGAPVTACAAEASWSETLDDCDEGSDEVHPEAEETWYDGIDQDCDGNDLDQDGDGFDVQDDCDDTDAEVHPDATERTDELVDYDCDGDGDNDGSLTDEDCQDDAPEIHPGALDACGDGLDADCDGSDACPRFEGEQGTDGLPLWSTSASARAGLRQVAVPDLDGDGADELFISAHVSGRSYLVADDIELGGDLATQNYLEGPAAETGRALAVGDVLGDGTLDLISAGYAENSSGAHLAIVDGSDAASGDLSSPLTLDQGHSGRYALVGVDAGDADGDGQDDIVLGSVGYGGGNHSGAAVFLGPISAGTEAAWTIAPSDTLESEARFGGSIELVDLSGDGLDELAIGAQYESSTGLDWHGHTFVFEGPVTADLETSDAWADHVGQSYNEQLGADLDSGDLDGSGYADLVMMAHQGNRFSVAFDPDEELEVDFTVAGERHFGHVVVADIDGDGQDDLAVGALGEDTGTGDGAVYIFYGPLSSTSLDPDNPTTHDAYGWDARVASDHESFGLGSSIAVGDFDGDGSQDLSMGGYGQWNGTATASGAYLLFGGDDL